MIKWLLTNLQAAGIVFLIGLASGSLGGAYIVKILWDLQNSAQMEESLNAMKTLSGRIQELEIEGDGREKIIRDFRRTTPTGGVQLPPATCGGSTVPGGSVQGPSADKPLPNPAQQAFDNYAHGTGDDALEADLAISDCRTMQDFLRGLKPKK